MRLLLLVLPFFITPLLYSQNYVPDTTLLQKMNRFSFGCYGAMNYYNFTWQTDSIKRNTIDNERLVMDIGYDWTSKIHFNTEIEFEHGGTGVSVEFDRFEEFGEFEFDVSKGGEVLIEQMNLDFQLSPFFNVKVGRLKVPFSLMFQRDEPTDYFTAINSEMESYILPENWTENGITAYGTIDKNQKWKYNIGIFNGLDGSAFNSANWIKRGNQRRFEMANAENIALATRIDYFFNDASSVGMSGYISNTTDNRPKPDLRVKAVVAMAEAHLKYQQKAITISAMALYGTLSNSEALTNQNRNLSNNLNVKRTPVGAAAVGAFAEIGISILGKNGIIKKTKQNNSILYTRWDYYDTMYKTQGAIFNNPRWQRHSVTIGAVYKIIDPVQFKIQYTMRKVGAPAPTSVRGGTKENTFVAGFAFEF